MVTAEWDDALLFDAAIDPFRQIAISGREDGRAAGRRDGYLEGVNLGRSKGWEIGLEVGYIQQFAQGIIDGYQQRRDSCQHQQHPHHVPPTSQQFQPSKQQICDDNIIPQSTPDHRTSHRLERCLNLSKDLVKMISDFPDPDSLLSQNNHVDSKHNSSNERVGTDEKVSSNDECCIGSEGKCSDKTPNGTCCKSDQEYSVGRKAATTGKDNRSQSKSNNHLLDVSASLERIRAKFKLLRVLLRTKQSFDLKNILEVIDIGDDDINIEATIDTSIEGNDDDQSETLKTDKSIESKPGGQGISNITATDSTAPGSDW